MDDQHNRRNTEGWFAAHLARRIREEQDPVKMIELWRALDEVMLQEERRKVRLRLAALKDTR